MACIEVVAGFVQDQPIGTAGPGTGQRHLHRLATAETRGRLGGVEVIGQPEHLPLLLQAFAQIPAVADAGEVGLIHAAGLDALQRGQFRADAGQLTNRAGGWITGRRQQEHRPLPRTWPLSGSSRPASRRASTLAGAIGTDQAGSNRFEGKRQIGKQQAPSANRYDTRSSVRVGSCDLHGWVLSLRAGGGKSQAVWWEDGGINGALVASLLEE